MAEKRKAISKKMRFEIFKRDSFTCQYCGKSSPDVVLEIDHIKPVCDGGRNDSINLVTACFDCNRGKGKRKLNNSKLQKTNKKELELLNLKKQQIEMFFEWKKELMDLDRIVINKINDILIKNDLGTLTTFGENKTIQLVNKMGLEEFIECLSITINNDKTEGNFLGYLSRVYTQRKLQEKKPYLYHYNYTKKVLSSRFRPLNKSEILKLKEIFENNYEDDDLLEFIKNCSKVCYSIDDFFNGTGDDNE